MNEANYLHTIIFGALIIFVITQISWITVTGITLKRKLFKPKIRDSTLIDLANLNNYANKKSFELLKTIYLPEGLLIFDNYLAKDCASICFDITDIKVRMFKAKLDSEDRLRIFKYHDIFYINHDYLYFYNQYRRIQETELNKDFVLELEKLVANKFVGGLAAYQNLNLLNIEN